MTTMHRHENTGGAIVSIAMAANNLCKLPVFATGSSSVYFLLLKGENSSLKTWWLSFISFYKKINKEYLLYHFIKRLTKSKYINLIKN